MAECNPMQQLLNLHVFNNDWDGSLMWGSGQIYPESSHPSLCSLIIQVIIWTPCLSSLLFGLILCFQNCNQNTKPINHKDWGLQFLMKLVSDIIIGFMHNGVWLHNAVWSHLLSLIRQVALSHSKGHLQHFWGYCSIYSQTICMKSDNLVYLFMYVMLFSLSNVRLTFYFPATKCQRDCSCTLYTVHKHLLGALNCQWLSITDASVLRHPLMKGLSFNRLKIAFFKWSDIIAVQYVSCFLSLFDSWYRLG